MESNANHYDVALQVCEPKFETERRYVLAELDYVRRQEAGARKWLGWASAGIYTRKDWQQYERQLVHYAHALDNHEREIHEGWMPFKIHVMNAGPHDDSQVSVELHVDDGAISEHKKAPDRPPRLDGRAKTTGLKLPRYQGFSRSGVQIRRHDMKATFSKLVAGDSADMVRQTLYLHYGPHTKLSFEINSNLVKGFTGELHA